MHWHVGMRLFHCFDIMVGRGIRLVYRRPYHRTCCCYHCKYIQCISGWLGLRRNVPGGLFLIVFVWGQDGDRFVFFCGMQLSVCSVVHSLCKAKVSAFEQSRARGGGNCHCSRRHSVFSGCHGRGRSALVARRETKMKTVNETTEILFLPTTTIHANFYTQIFFWP